MIDCLTLTGRDERALNEVLAAELSKRDSLRMWSIQSSPDDDQYRTLRGVLRAMPIGAVWLRQFTVARSSMVLLIELLSKEEVEKLNTTIFEMWEGEMKTVFDPNRCRFGVWLLQLHPLTLAIAVCLALELEKK